VNSGHGTLGPIERRHVLIFAYRSWLRSSLLRFHWAVRLFTFAASEALSSVDVKAENRVYFYRLVAAEYRPEFPVVQCGQNF
jgi:hypothetical protein